MQIDLMTLKLGLLLFWAVWLSLVFLTNLFAGLKAIGILPDKWKFASKNYEAVVKTTSTYTATAWLPGFLFAGVILWQGLALFLFWLASIRSIQGGSLNLTSAATAFAVSLGLWAAFMIADEVFQVYETERSHLLILVGQLLTLISFYVLPS